MLAEFISGHLGLLANALACALVLLPSLIFGLLLNHNVVREATGSAAPLRLIPTAFWMWVLAWAFWTCFYALRVVLAWHGDSAEAWTFPLLVLSDLNSAFFLLVFYILTRGDMLTRFQCGLLALIAAIAVLAIDATLLGVERNLFPASDAMPLTTAFSVSLAMAAPFLLGRAYRFRYGTHTIWIIGACYALAQPFGYIAAMPSASTGSADVYLWNEDKACLEGLTPKLARFVSGPEAVGSSEAHKEYRLLIGGLRPLAPPTVTEMQPLDSVDGKQTQRWTFSVEMETAAGATPPTPVANFAPDPSRSKMVKYTIRNKGPSGEPMSLDDHAAIAEKLSCLSPLARLRVWAQLRFADITLGFIALLKLAFASAIFSYAQARPLSMRRVFDVYQLRKPWQDGDRLVPEFKYFNAIMIVLIALLGIGALVVAGGGVFLTHVLGGVGIASVWLLIRAPFVRRLLGVRGPPSPIDRVPGQEVIESPGDPNWTDD